jgi:hypothetical protein
MILRNLTSNEQTFNDGPQVKTVAPQALVAVTPETGALLLTQLPHVWVAEAPIVPPPPAR